MDISSLSSLELKTPAKTGGAAAAIDPVPIEDLKLIQGRNYAAQVLGPAEELLALTDQSKQQLSEQKAIITLLRVQDKVIASQSELQLPKGLAIQIRLSADGNLVMLANPAITYAPSIKPITQSSLTNAMNQVLTQQTSLALGIETLTKALAATENSAPLKAIVNILESAIPQRDALLAAGNSAPSSLTNSGNVGPTIKGSPAIENQLTQLLNNLAQLSTSSNPDNRAALESLAQKLDAGQINASVVKQIQKLLNGMPVKGDSLPTNPSPMQTGSAQLKPESQASQIKQWIQQSGVLLENQWKHNPQSLKNHTHNLQDLIKIIQQTQAATGNSVTKTQDNSQNSQTSSTNANISGKQNRTTNESLSRALDFIKGAIASQAAQTSTAVQSNSALAGKESNNLKATLQLITSALSQVSAEEPKGKEGFLQVDLLKYPFNFPPPTTNIAQAAAILADQDLSTGQLLKLMAGMLNRIHFNQLNSLLQTQTNSADVNPTQTWFMELPTSIGNGQFAFFNMRLEREERDANSAKKQKLEKETVWKIGLSFELEPLGPIFIQANLVPPSVSTTIWAEKRSTLKLLQEEVPYFRDKLSDLGLEVGDIRCQKGQPKQTKTNVDQHLVDTKA